VRRFFLAMGLAAAGLVQAASGLTLEQLFETLAKQRPERAAFQERKYLALLDRPVDSSGTLAFTPPARLEKRTLLPRPETLVADGDTVVLERGGRRQALSLAGNPAIAALIESIRATLAGDIASIRRAYAAELAGNADGWRITLRPLDAAVAPLVSRIEIAGVGGEVRQVEVFQADGDRSVMTITKTP